MKISEFIKDNLVILDLKAKTAKDSISELAANMGKEAGMKDIDQFIKDVLKREKMATTGIGYEVAIPHARTDAASEIIIAVGVSKKGVDFKSLDGNKAKIVFLIATPISEINNYLKLLAQLTRMIKDKVLRNQILNAAKVSDIVNAFKELGK